MILILLVTIFNFQVETHQETHQNHCEVRAEELRSEMEWIIIHGHSILAFEQFHVHHH
jgi:hypothetical protein